MTTKWWEETKKKKKWFEEESGKELEGLSFQSETVSLEPKEPELKIEEETIIGEPLKELPEEKIIAPETRVEETVPTPNWWKQKTLPLHIDESWIRMVYPLTDRIAILKQYQSTSEGKYLRKPTLPGVPTKVGLAPPELPESPVSTEGITAWSQIEEGTQDWVINIEETGWEDEEGNHYPSRQEFLAQFPDKPKVYWSRDDSLRYTKGIKLYDEMLAQAKEQESKRKTAILEQERINSLLEEGNMEQAIPLLRDFIATQKDNPDFTTEQIDAFQVQLDYLENYPNSLIDELPETPPAESFEGEAPETWQEAFGLKKDADWRAFLRENTWLVTGEPLPLEHTELEPIAKLLLDEGIDIMKARTLINYLWKYGSKITGMGGNTVPERLERVKYRVEVAIREEGEVYGSLKGWVEHRLEGYAFKELPYWKMNLETLRRAISIVPVAILSGWSARGLPWEEAEARYEAKPLWQKIAVEFANPIWYIIPFGLGWKGLIAVSSKIPIIGKYLAPAIIKTGAVASKATGYPFTIPNKIFDVLTGRQKIKAIQEITKAGGSGFVPRSTATNMEQLAEKAIPFAERVPLFKFVQPTGEAIIKVGTEIQATRIGRVVTRLPGWAQYPVKWINPAMILKKLPEGAWDAKAFRLLADQVKFINGLYREQSGPFRQWLFSGIYKISAGKAWQALGRRNTIYKFFGADIKTGIVTKGIKPRAEFPNAPMHISDILEHPEKYIFATAQGRELVTNLNAVKEAIFRYLFDNGVELHIRVEGKKVLLTEKNLAHYFPRIVYEKELSTGEIIERAFLTPHPDRPRSFEFAEMGTKTGYHYLDPAQTLELLSSWAFTEVANKKTLDYFTSQIGKDLSRQVAARYPEVAANKVLWEGAQESWQYLYKQLMGLARGKINLNKLSGAELRKISTTDADIGEQLRVLLGRQSTEAKFASGKRLKLTEVEFIAGNRGFTIKGTTKRGYQILDREGGVAFEGRLGEIGKWLRLKEPIKPIEPVTLGRVSGELANVLSKRAEMGMALPKGLEGKLTLPEIEAYLAKLSSKEVEGLYTEITGKAISIAKPPITPQATFANMSNQAKAKLAEIKPKLAEARRDYSKAVESLKYPRFSEGVVNWGHFRGKYLPIQFTTAMNQELRGQASTWLRYTSIAASVPRMLVAGLDLSWGFIQGLMMLTSNPVIWAKAQGNSLQAVVDERIYWQLIDKHWKTAAEMVTHRGYLGSFEYFDAFKPIEGFIEKRFPERIGKLPTMIMNQTYGRFNAAWGTMGDMARIYGWEAWSPSIKAKYGDDGLRWLGEHLNLMTGVTTFQGLGIGANKSAFLNSWVFFAPRYTYSGFAMMGNCLRGGLKGELARESLAKLLFMGTLYYAGAAKAIGMTWEEVLDGLTPTSRRFLSLRVGGGYIGIGSIWYSMARLFGDIALTTKDGELVDFAKLDRWDNPFIKFWFNRTSQLTSAILLGTGLPPVDGQPQDYLGEPLQSPGDYLKFASGYALPISLQSYLLEEQRSAARTGAEFCGMRTSPVEAWKIRDELRERYAQEEYSEREGWINLMSSEQEELEKRYPDLANATERAKIQSAKFADVPWDEWEGEREIYQDRFKELVGIASNQFLSCRKENPTGGDCGENFREAISSAGFAYGEEMELLRQKTEYKELYEFLDEQEIDPEITYAPKLAYFDWVDKIYNSSELASLLGEEYWDLREILEKEFIDKWGQENYDIVQQELRYGKDYTKVYKEYKEGSDILKPYWELRETLEASGKNPKNKQQQLEWIIRDMAENNPGAADIYRQVLELKETDRKRYDTITASREWRTLSQWASELSIPTVDAILRAKRIELRKENPQMEAYGVMFRDWVPLEEQGL